MSLLHELKTTLRPADFLDIAIVSVLVYATIRWGRRARSRFMLLGLATLVVLYLAARLLNMYLTLFLFQVGLTAAVVTIEAGQVRPVSRHEIPHARAIASG